MVSVADPSTGPQLSRITPGPGARALAQVTAHPNIVFFNALREWLTSDAATRNWDEIYARHSGSQAVNETAHSIEDSWQASGGDEAQAQRVKKIARTWAEDKGMKWWRAQGTKHFREDLESSIGELREQARDERPFNSGKSATPPHVELEPLERMPAPMQPTRGMPGKAYGPSKTWPGGNPFPERIPPFEPPLFPAPAFTTIARQPRPGLGGMVTSLAEAAYPVVATAGKILTNPWVSAGLGVLDASPLSAFENHWNDLNAAARNEKRDGGRYGITVSAPRMTSTERETAKAARTDRLINRTNSRGQQDF
jgi:hypothetical protein